MEDKKLFYTVEDIQHECSRHFIGGMVAGAGAILILYLFVIYAPW